MFRYLIVLILAISTTNALGRNLDGRYNNYPKEIKEWYQAQNIPRGPNKGRSCCSTADATKAQEDIRDGDYWVSFSACTGPVEIQTCTPVNWMKVPEEAILERHPNGPVVWWESKWSEEKGNYIAIRCYAPGTKVQNEPVTLPGD